MLATLTPIVLQSIENCDLDMTVQECIEAQIPVPPRPALRYLSAINLLYILETFAIAISVRIVKEFSSSVDIFWANWSTWMIVVLEGPLYGIASGIISWYLINGRDSEEFEADEGLMVDFMDEYCRNWGFYVHLFGVLTFLIQGIVDGEFIQFMVTIAYVLIVGLLEYASWTQLSKAIRVVDPFWDKNEGNYYPEMFYYFGWATLNPVGAQDTAEKGAEEPTEDPAEEPAEEGFTI